MLLFLMLIAEDDHRDKILWLFETYHDNMLRYARSLLALYGDKRYMRDSEDIVQSAFIKITKSIDKIDISLPEKVVGGYIMTVVKNEVADFIKKEKKNIPLDDMLTICEDCNYLEEFSKKDLYKRAVGEIERMEPIYRDVMILKFIEEMTAKEIASELGIPEKTVYTRISRAIGALKERFKGEVI